MKRYNTDNISEWANEVRAGESISLSGVIYTARDAAHKKICEAISHGEPLPFDLKGACIYYAGPGYRYYVGLVHISAGYHNHRNGRQHSTRLPNNFTH